MAEHIVVKLFALRFAHRIESAKRLFQHGEEFVFDQFGVRIRLCAGKNIVLCGDGLYSYIAAERITLPYVAQQCDIGGEKLFVHRKTAVVPRDAFDGDVNIHLSAGYPL